MLRGTFILLEPGVYGFEHISESSGKPERSRMVWRVTNVGQGRGNLAWANVMEAMNKEARCENGVVSVYCGHGAYIRGELENNAAAVVEVTAVPKPKVRSGVEVRWHHDGYRGFWQKYLKTQGWVRA